MAENDSKMQRLPGASNKAPRTVYQQTKSFLKYLTLVQASLSMRDETAAGSIRAERDRVTEELARKRARNIGEVFEKIYVWRMESFDPGDTGFIYFDDMFPLSVYFDLQRLIRFDGAAEELDRLLEGRLRGAIEEPAMEKEDSVEASVVPFAKPDSSQVH